MLGLFFHLSLHITFSLFVGVVVWKIWGKSFLSFGCALLSGVLVDLDHLIDYFFAFGFHFKMDYFLQGYSFLKNDKIYVLFHSWEYVILLIILVFWVRRDTVRTMFLALTLGLFLHLLVDVNLNNMTFKSYSIIYRIKNNFDLRKIEKTHIFENDSIIIK